MPKLACSSCTVYMAVVRFSEPAFAALARKIVWRLQRLAANSIYGDDFQHKTLWDEYCYEVQNGRHDLLEHAWETTIGPLADNVVEAVPHQEAALLTIGAAWALDEHELELEGNPPVAPDLIGRNLRQVVAQLAAARDMSRFDPSGLCWT